MKSETVLRLSPLQPDATVSRDDAEGGLDIGQLLRTLRRKWFVILGVTLATTAAAAAKTLTDTALYESRLEILVQPISAETEVTSNVPETFEGESNPASVLNADLLKILRSPGVLAPVVAQVKSSYPEFCTDSPDPVDISKLENADRICYNSIVSGLQLNALAVQSDILQVNFEDPEIEKVTTVLGLVADAYLQYSLASRQADISRGIDFVNKKLPDLRAKVDSLQNQLQNLRLENDLVDPESRGNQLSGQMDAFSKEQLQISVELQQNREIYENLRRQLQQPTESASSSALASNPRYQNLLNSLLALDSEIAESSTLFLDSSPDMEILKEERQNLLTLLSQQGRQSEREIINRIRELESREEALNRTIRSLNSDIGTLAGISREYTDIERELAVATDNLTQFLTKKEALEIDAAQREIPWEVVTPPTVPNPQPVSLPQNLLLGGILGLLLGSGLALLLDQSAGVIHSDEEIRRTTRLPVLGRIPKQALSEGATVRVGATRALAHVGAVAASTNAKAVNANSSGHALSSNTGQQDYVTDPFAESFRSLYTNLRLINSPNPIRSVVISSVMPGEGKSTVAMNLAETVAAAGKRVLLVDADLRNPSLHTYLEISNEKGLTNLFSGESNPAIIQKFAPDSTLYVIAAGSAAFEPTRLFSSRGMRQFVEQIQPKFDLVIYDTPPLIGQSDAYLVAAKADGLLIVTNPGQLKQAALDRAMEQLNIAGINVLGLVNREH
ncbi:MAG: polysaccharide biosynthesis tyrosine autokinase [Cyanobacteria bacterium J06623_4]